MKKVYLAFACALVLIIAAGAYISHRIDMAQHAPAAVSGVLSDAAAAAGGALATTTQASVAEASSVSAAASQKPVSNQQQVPASPNKSVSATASRQAVSAQTRAAVSSPNGWYYVFVAPDDYFKTPGGSVVFHGSHFYPGETVTMSHGNRTLGTAIANASGKFMSGEITVPYGVSKATYIFEGDVSDLPFSVTLTVGPRNPWIELNNYYVSAGSRIVVSGHQFGSNESVSISIDGSTVKTVTTSADGEFATTISIPHSQAGQRTIAAKGALTGTLATQEFSQSE